MKFNSDRLNLILLSLILISLTEFVKANPNEAIRVDYNTYAPILVLAILGFLSSKLIKLPNKNNSQEK
jgi:hypothetical protein